MTTTCATSIAWVRREGGASLPAPYAMKGCVVPGWATVRPEVTEGITSAWLDGTPPEGAPVPVRDWLTRLETDERNKFLRSWKRHAGNPVNLAGRTSETFAVADIDQWEGAEEVIARFPQGCPVDRSARGFRVYFRPARPIGNGSLVGIKGEYFTGSPPHLVMLPPSRHPSGVDYEWVRPPNGSLPTVDLVAMGLASPGEPKVSSTQRRRLGPGELTGTVAELARLLGDGEPRGRWTMFRCPFHACAHGDKEFGVTPDGWCQCFACHESGWADTVTRRLGVCSGNFVPGAEAWQQRVIGALEVMGLSRLAHEMSLCGRSFKVYRCEQGHAPAYPVSCKSPYCPRCRGRRLAAHLASKGALFAQMSHPVGLRITPPTMDVNEATDARRKVRAQTDALVQSLRALTDVVPQLRNTIRVMTASCENLGVKVTHAVAVDGLDEKARASIVMALRQVGANVEVEQLQDGEAASRWLYRRAVRFEFKTNEDLVTLLLAFKGMSIVRGWGEFRSATGGMLKGKTTSREPVCPFCGSKLGKAIDEVPADQVEWVDGKGFRWRGPPT